MLLMVDSASTLHPTKRVLQAPYLVRAASLAARVVHPAISVQIRVTFAAPIVCLPDLQ